VIAAARGLQSGTRAGRVKAVHDPIEVGKADPGVAISALIGVSGDDAVGVRVAVAEALGFFGTEAIRKGGNDGQIRSAISAVLGSLKDREPAVRIAAAKSLGTIAGCGPTIAIDLAPAVGTLVELLDDPDADVRRAVIWTLGFVGPGVLVDPPATVVAALESQSAQDQAAAVDSLANFTRGLPRLIPSLIRSMEKAWPEARGSYARLFTKIEPPKFTAAAVPYFIAALGSEDRAIRSAAATCLGKFKRAAVAAVLINVLREASDPNGPPPGTEFETFPVGDPSLAAARALAQIAQGTHQTDQAVAALAEAVRSGRPECRVVAAEVLGLFGLDAEEAIPTLIAALRKAIAIETPVRQYDRNSEESVAPLVGDWSARSLGKIAPGTPSEDHVFAILTEALQSESTGVAHTTIKEAILPF
jgi:HEAT repeat protein